MPYNDYFEYYGPDFKLHISPSNMANQNTPEYMEKIKTRLFENLRMLPHAPGVQMADIPEDAVREESEDEGERQNPDQRVSSTYTVQKTYFICDCVVLCFKSNINVSLWIAVRASDKRITCDEEFSDSEDEGEGGGGGRRHKESYKTLAHKKLKVDEERNGEKKEGEHA